MTRLASIPPPRPLHLLSVTLVLAVLLLSGLGGAPLFSAGRSTPIRPAAAGADFVTAGGPTQPCPGGNPGFSTYLILASPNTTGPLNGSQWVVGPSPINVTLNVSLWGAPITYNATVNWGDGSVVQTDFDKTIGNGTQSFLVSHVFTFPAMFQPWVWTNYTCASGPATNRTGSYHDGAALTVYGPAGPTPITATANETSAPVPATVAYNASVAGAPANALAQWTVGPEEGGTTIALTTPLAAQNNSSFVPDLKFPGLYTGSLRILYPGSGLIYAQTLLPSVNVTPLAWVGLADVNATGRSPWNVTYWGNVTNLSGSSYALGADTVSWSFDDSPAGTPTGAARFWAYGPTVGSPVWREYYDNRTGDWNVSTSVSVVRPDGVTIAFNYTNLELYSNQTAYIPPTLSFAATPPNGSAPLALNLTAQMYGYNASRGFAVLDADAVLIGVGTVWTFNSSTNRTWGYSARNWTGWPLTIPEVLTAAGDYRIFASVQEDLSGNWTWMADANLTVLVSSATSSSPPSLSFSASPDNGSAPLNLSLSFVAVGGSAPYDLAVCVEGPFSSPNGTGPCTGVGAATGWSGSALALPVALNTTGNYTLVATVTDTKGLNCSAVATVLVMPPAPVPPLTVHGSSSGASGITSGGATYAFVASVSGGVAPYNIQWTFGDGTSGSSMPGATVLHTYTVSGTFTATLTVTDARNHRVSTAVGPLVVALPLARGADTPWWATTAVIGFAAVVGVVSAAVLVWTTQRLARRREALNWLQELEAKRDTTGPETGPK
ncbi:MAG TPA: PKD domain-containing protein [Thermoplasmata archaeon]|nr:PKD domain-containing protein [Thermoplasmata archaeon]